MRLEQPPKPEEPKIFLGLLNQSQLEKPQIKELIQDGIIKVATSELETIQEASLEGDPLLEVFLIKEVGDETKKGIEDLIMNQNK